MTLQPSWAMRNRRECGQQQQQQKMEIEMRDREKIIVSPWSSYIWGRLYTYSSQLQKTTHSLLLLLLLKITG